MTLKENRRCVLNSMLLAIRDGSLREIQAWPCLYLNKDKQFAPAGDHIDLSCGCPVPSLKDFESLQ